jgi:hypothetical protein
MTGAEKRVFRRFPVELTAHCRLGNRYVRDAVADLSEGGLYLRTWRCRTARARTSAPWWATWRASIATPAGTSRAWA